MPKKILLADDSVTIQKVVELTFVEGDYEVTCVSNGKAAVQKIQEARPDVLLCDVIMPEMNGYEVASFIKKNPTFSAIPVILLTGTFEPFDEEKARASGADTYITKPFDSRLLVEKVEELISRRAVFDTAATAEPVQVFHSRQEFTLETPASLQAAEPVVASAEVLPAPPSAEAFIAEEPEFMLPAEQEVGMGTVQSLAPPPAPPVVYEPPPEPSADESPFMEPAFAPATVAAAAAPPLEVPPVLAGAPETVDLGPMTPEDAIPEAEAPVGVPPAHEFLAEPGEVVLPPELPSESLRAPAEEEVAVSVAGAEDWGTAETPMAEQKWASFEPEPEEAGAVVVHSMTEQQEMVSEAQSILDQQRPPAEAEAPLSEMPAQEGAGVPEAAEAFAPVTEEVPEEQPTAPALPREAEEEQTPFLPEEGIETGLPEIMEVAPAEVAAGVREQPEATVEPEVLAEPPKPELETGIPIEEAAIEEPPPLEPEVAPAAAEVPAHAEAPLAEPEVEEALEPQEPAAVPAAPVGKVEVDPAEVERLVRQVLQEIAPPIVREATAAMIPGLVGATVAESVSEEARKAVAEVAAAVTRQAAESAVPEAARQAVVGYLPGTVAEVAKAEVPLAVRELAEPMISGLVRQVAEENTKYTIRQFVESMAPTLLAETLQRSLPDLVGENLKAVLPELVAKEVRETAAAIVREVAWEVIPELAESLIKRRIQELESEVG